MEKIQLACRGRLNLLTTTTTSSPPPATRIRPPPGDRRSQPPTSDPTAMSVPAISFYASPTAGFSASPASHAAPSPYPDLDFAPRVPTTASSRRPAPGGLSCLFSSPPLPADEPEDLGCSHPYSYASPLRLHHSPVSVFHGPVSQGRASSGRRAAAQSFPRELARGGRDRMLGGFVRNALGCDVPREAPGRDAPDLPFEIELDEDREPYAAEMLSRLRARHRIFADDVVVEAFYEAEKAHRGQVRASGDPYLQHCAETAALLADIGANATIVAAGLLHDSMDDSSLNYDCIFRSFGAGVATLVVGVSRLSHLSKLARENDTACKSVEADRLRTMFLAMGDARAVLIKLADRLHNMMTLDALPPSKRERFAKETLEIFVPMANRLGVFNWKEQLENLCFKYLYTEQHKEISTKLAKSFDETMVANAEGKLEAALVAGGISYHALYGRHKSLYSIHCKMLKKNVTMNEIHDIHGLRLIVESEDDCYKALDIVHRLWTKVPERQKDYIAHPKFNGYQSLHTVVQNEDMQSIEIQIRTKEMHRHAEYGFAAHWRYKEGFRRHASYVVQIAEWARWVLTWQCETMHKDCHLSFNDIDSNRPLCSFPLHSEDCPYNNKPECNQDDPIYVILLENEMMSVQEFPPNSTMLELLERVSPGTAHWTTHGFPLNEELRPRLNSRPVIDLDQKLKMGDVIELTPAIPDESLPVYRKEIQRIFERGMAVRGVDYF